MIHRIFLDLDDVCNTLAMYVLHIRGINISPTDYAEFPAECGYDVVMAANLLGAQQYTIPDFWGTVTRKQWAAVPETDFFPWLLDACERLVGRENVCIATSPTKAPDSLAGKLEWIHAHFPPWMHRQYAITPRKYLFARPDALLIDDNPTNIDTFIQNGGQGLLVPRPWNVYADCDAKTHLERQFAKIVGPNMPG
jgi:hypothetical protein